MNEIAISHLIFRQKDQVIPGGILLSFPVKTGAPCHVHLAANNGMHTLCLASLIKAHSTIERAMIGDGNSGMSRRACGGRNLRNTASAVKKAVFTVYMKMDEGVHGISPFKVIFRL